MENKVPRQAEPTAPWRILIWKNQSWETRVSSHDILMDSERRFYNACSTKQQTGAIATLHIAENFQNKTKLTKQINQSVLLVLFSKFECIRYIR